MERKQDRKIHWTKSNLRHNVETMKTVKLRNYIKTDYGT